MEPSRVTITYCHKRLVNDCWCLSVEGCFFCLMVIYHSSWSLMLFNMSESMMDLSKVMQNKHHVVKLIRSLSQLAFFQEVSLQRGLISASVQTCSRIFRIYHPVLICFVGLRMGACRTKKYGSSFSEINMSVCMYVCMYVCILVYIYI